MPTIDLAKREEMEKWEGKKKSRVRSRLPPEEGGKRAGGRLVLCIVKRPKKKAELSLQRKMALLEERSNDGGRGEKKRRPFFQAREGEKPIAIFSSERRGERSGKKGKKKKAVHLTKTDRGRRPKKRGGGHSFCASDLKTQTPRPSHPVLGKKPAQKGTKGSHPHS